MLRLNGLAHFVTLLLVMTIITIHCHLVAPEPIRRSLWYLMTESNTPLVNDLLKQVSQQDDFETWQRRGILPETAIRVLCEELKEKYPGQPGRFYTSAILMVKYTYESWLSLQQSRRWRIDGKQRWLNVVKSDTELIELSGSTLDEIRQRSQEILDEFDAELKNQTESDMETQEETQNQTSSSKKISLISRLFKTYENTDDVLDRCAFSYLIKNRGTLPKIEEDPEKFAHWIHRKQKEVERLETQLHARQPRGRDLAMNEFLETLATATQQVPETVAQMQDWQKKLLTRPITLPYPIIYGSSTDIRWSKTAKGRITVNFSGIDKYLKMTDPDLKEWFKTHKEYPFQLYCDQRQLLFFQQFLEDWQTYQANKDTYPAGLLTLCSAMLVWREGEGRGKPWNSNRLALHCSFDTRLLTAEGTLAVQQEKTDKAIKQLTYKNPDPRNHSTLNRLNNLPTNRSNRQSYQGNSEILVGLSVGLTTPVTAVVVNGGTGKVITCRTPRTLLQDQYHLLNRHRYQQRQHAMQRQKNQRCGVAHLLSESELGQLVDRLLAKAIIQLAQTFQAGSIVIPTLTNLREILTSEIAAKAERKCPGAIEAQNQYAKEYRKAIHQWSYDRLITAVRSKATQSDIPIEVGFQPTRGDPRERAKDLAIAVYNARITDIL